MADPNIPNPNSTQQAEASLKRLQLLLDQVNRSYNTLGEKSPFSREASKVVKGFENAEKAIEAMGNALAGVTSRINEIGRAHV